MMSINTTSMSRRILQNLDRIPAGFRRQDMHIISLQHARESENIANVVIHDQHLAAIEHRIVFVELLQHLPLRLGKFRNRHDAAAG